MLIMRIRRSSTARVASRIFYHLPNCNDNDEIIIFIPARRILDLKQEIVFHVIAVMLLESFNFQSR